MTLLLKRQKDPDSLNFEDQSKTAKQIKPILRKKPAMTKELMKSSSIIKACSK